MLIPVLLISLLVGHSVQAIYFNSKPTLATPPNQITQIPLAPAVQGTSTINSQSTPSPTSKPTPTPTASPKTVIFSNQLLEALNNYRQKNGRQPLSPDSNLQNYSKQRSDLYQNIGKIDNHAGFNNLLQNEGFNKLGFFELAENSSFGYNLSAVDLIENIFGKSDYHNKNMLNPIYTHIGIGVSGSAANFVFGGRKI